MTLGPEFRYGEYFEPVATQPFHPVIQEAEDYLTGRDISKLPFFETAASLQSALRLWVTQELIITGPFSQLLHRVASQLRNVNLRAMLGQVISGEHGQIDNHGVAKSAHPMLLVCLQKSMGIAASEIRPLPEIKTFIGVLEEQCSHPLSGIGALGVGNERMLLDEYRAVLIAFERCWPDAQYSNFLMANITEDAEHADLMARIGTGLINQGHDPQLYLIGARIAVDAIITYYDRLLERVQRFSP